MTIAVKVRVNPGYCVVERGWRYWPGMEFETYPERIKALGGAVEVLSVPETPRYTPQRAERTARNRLEKTALNRGGV